VTTSAVAACAVVVVVVAVVVAVVVVELALAMYTGIKPSTTAITAQQKKMTMTAIRPVAANPRLVLLALSAPCST
jgi:hypothetical protein